VRGGDTGIPCASGTCSYAAQNTQFEGGKGMGTTADSWRSVLRPRARARVRRTPWCCQHRGGRPCRVARRWRSGRQDRGRGRMQRHCRHTRRILRAAGPCPHRCNVIATSGNPLMTGRAAEIFLTAVGRVLTNQTAAGRVLTTSAGRLEACAPTAK
jgi:hypothetical protein